MQTNNNSYINEIHFLRAFACLGVLMVHVSGVFFYQHGQTYNWLTFFINSIGRFGTPIFAVISGFLLFYSVRNRGFNLKYFIKSRTAKVVLPLVIWSVFYLWVTKYIMGGIVPTDLSTIWFNFVTGLTFYHLYFMSVVVQFYLLFPFLQRLKSKQTWLQVLIVSLVITIYFSNFQYVELFSGNLAAFVKNKVFILDWLFYFIFGGYIAYHWEEICEWVKGKEIWFTVITILLVIGTVVEYKFVGYVSSRRLTNFINIPLLCFAVISLYGWFNRYKLISKSLFTIGKLSMGIYLIHPFVLVIMQKYIPVAYWQTELFPVFYGAVLIGSIMIVKFIQRIPKHQFIIPVPTVNKRNRKQEKKLSA